MQDQFPGAHTMTITTMLLESYFIISMILNVLEMRQKFWPAHVIQQEVYALMHTVVPLSRVQVGK